MRDATCQMHPPPLQLGPVDVEALARWHGLEVENSVINIVVAPGPTRTTTGATTVSLDSTGSFGNARLGKCRYTFQSCIRFVTSACPAWTYRSLAAPRCRGDSLAHPVIRVCERSRLHRALARGRQRGATVAWPTGRVQAKSAATDEALLGARHPGVPMRCTSVALYRCELSTTNSTANTITVAKPSSSKVARSTANTEYPCCASEIPYCFLQTTWVFPICNADSERR